MITLPPIKSFATFFPAQNIIHKRDMKQETRVRFSEILKPLNTGFAFLTTQAKEHGMF